MDHIKDKKKQNSNETKDRWQKYESSDKSEIRHCKWETLNLRIIAVLKINE